MTVLEGSLLDAVAGLAAMFLGLAVLVQVLQEIYKFLTSSKYRSYAKVLVDSLGPWATQLLEPGSAVDLRVSGPFQLKKLRPGGILLPMDKTGLTDALERTAPLWICRTMEQLKLECELRGNKESKPSPAWVEFLRQLGKVEKGSPGYWDVLEIAGFLSVWGHEHDRDESAPQIGRIIAPEEFSARELLKAFRKKFLPHVDNVDRQFPQLERNFHYAYKRRNLRQTFTIAFTVAILFNLTFERIYTSAIKATPEEAAALAERAVSLYESRKEGVAGADSTEVEEQLALARKVMEGVMATVSQEKKIVDYIVDRDDIFGLTGSRTVSLLRFVLGCLLTAVLVSFGAPFWNDILGRVARTRRQKKPAKNYEVVG